MWFKSLKIIILPCFLAILPGVVCGQEMDPQAQELSALRSVLETTSKNLVDINSELLVLRETTQFPERSQMVVFLTMAKLPRFQLESVELQLNSKTISSRNYNASEKEAMQKGGFHRFYIGNLDVGAHTVKAVFKGKVSGTQGYSDSVSYNFRKADKPKVFTLSISDLLQDNMPEITLREDR